MSGLLTLPYPSLLDRIIAGVPGGIKNKILFTPVNNIVAYGGVQPVVNSVISLTLNGIALGQAKMPDADKGISEKSGEEVAGKFTNSQVWGMLPYYNKDNAYTLNQMKYYRWIVIVGLRNGTYRIFGTPENGCHFDYDFTSGGAGKDVAMAKVAWNWKSEDGAPYYEVAGFSI